MSAQLVNTPESKRVHLGTFAVNAHSGHDGYRTGRMVPICSTDPGISLWSYWYGGGDWPDKPKPLCRACAVRLAELSALAASTEER